MFHDLSVIRIRCKMLNVLQWSSNTQTPVEVDKWPLSFQKVNREIFIEAQYNMINDNPTKTIQTIQYNTRNEAKENDKFISTYHPSFYYCFQVDMGKHLYIDKTER